MTKREDQCRRQFLEQHDNILFAAALATVTAANCYEIVADADAIVVSSECVLACWGRSDVVRRISNRCIKDVASSAMYLMAKFNHDIVDIVHLQPFMQPGWQPDGNDNVAVSHAVTALLHRWERRPWTKHRTFVRLAEQHCLATARLAQVVAPRVIAEMLGNVPPWEHPNLAVADNTLDLAELGANVADLITPCSGSVQPEAQVWSFCKACNKCHARRG